MKVKKAVSGGRGSCKDGVATRGTGEGSTVTAYSPRPLEHEPPPHRCH